MQVAGADLRPGCEVSSSTEPASLSPPAPRLCARDAAHQPAHSPASKCGLLIGTNVPAFEYRICPPATLAAPRSAHNPHFDALWITRQRERGCREHRGVICAGPATRLGNSTAP